MRETKLAIYISIILIIIFIGASYLRWINKVNIEVDPDFKRWKLSYNIAFQNPDLKNKLTIRIPSDTQGYQLVKEKFDFANLSTVVENEGINNSRKIVGVALRKTVPSGFNGEFELVQKNQKAVNQIISTEERFFYLRSEPKIQANDPIVLSTGQRLNSSGLNKKQLINVISKYVNDEITLSTDGDDNASAAFTNMKSVSLGKVRALIALARSLRIPARVVTGFILQPSIVLAPHSWVEIYYNKKWFAFDPLFGYEWEIPKTFFPVTKNTFNLVSGIQKRTTNEIYRLIQINAPVASANQENDYKAMFSLERLPIGMRNIISIILLIPVGVLITALYRSIIGLKTFGTFAPSLIALSFVMSDWRTGSVVLFGAILAGFAVRVAIDQLKLLMIPRVGLILTFTIVLMTITISVFDFFGLTPGANAVLLPTVIIALLIERIYISEIEDGTGNVLKLIAGTLVVIISCFFIFNSDTLRNVMISYPETIYLVSALLILIGRYSGYRFSELIRFRDLSRSTDHN